MCQEVNNLVNYIIYLNKQINFIFFKKKTKDRGDLFIINKAEEVNPYLPNFNCDNLNIDLPMLIEKLFFCINFKYFFILFLKIFNTWKPRLS